MATWTSRLVTVNRYEWYVPKKSNHAEVMKMYTEARQEFERIRCREPEYDTDLWFYVGADPSGEEVIVVGFEEEEEHEG